tara:strand:+ start:525 stop:710 length:186 start_codon:yes stop_codon:yes gene_type:complete
MDKELQNELNHSMSLIKNIVLNHNDPDIQSNLANHGAVFQVELCLKNYFDMCNNLLGKNND